MVLTSNWFEIKEEPAKLSWDSARNVCGRLLEFDFEYNSFSEGAAAEKNVEADIRTFAEVILWGSKNDSSVIQLIQDMNMIAMLLSWLSKDKISAEIKVQALLTLSIVMQNIEAEFLPDLMPDFQILSDGAVCAKASDDANDLTPAFVNFLRAIFSRIEPSNIFMYYEKKSANITGLWIVIDFMMHGDDLVRATARSIFINVLTRSITEIQHFIETWGGFLSCVISESFVRKIIIDEEKLSCQNHSTHHGESLTSIGTQGDDLIDICSFLDDSFDSTKGAQAIVNQIFDAILCHVAEIEHKAFQFECIRKIIAPATHPLYVRSLASFLKEFNSIYASHECSMSIDEAYIAILLATSKNISLTNHMALTASLGNEHALPDRAFLHPCIFQAEKLILKIAHSPSAVTIAGIMLIYELVRCNITEGSRLKESFHAVLYESLLILYDFIKDLGAIPMNSSDDCVSADPNDLPDSKALKSVTRIASSFATFEYVLSMGVDEFCRRQWLAAGSLHTKASRHDNAILLFIAFVEIFESISNKVENKVCEVFSFMPNAPQHFTAVETGSFSSDCGMIGIRCLILQRSIAYTDNQRRTPDQGQMRHSGILFASEDDVSNDSLLYLFFGNESLYLVHPSLDNLGYGKIVFQLPIFYCSTIVYCSTDSEITLECIALNEPESCVCRIKLDFQSCATSKSVADSLFVYTRKVQNKAIARTRTLFSEIETAICAK